MDAKRQPEQQGVCAGAGARRISILGATGSIGTSTLDLIGRAPADYRVVALTAQSSVAALADLAQRFRAEVAAIGDATLLPELQRLLAGTGITALGGAAGVVEAARLPADWTMAAIVGAAGLSPTFAAAEQGGCVALANKECLVSAGRVFLDAIAASGARLLPVDSEHSGLLQALGASPAETVEQMTLTASGGPFREWPAARLATARVEDALKHPTWAMGRKITIDSATLMNKGLELIEAAHLFALRADQLTVVVHPQSIVHALVTFCDGSTVAQLSHPDMRVPIALSLAWPSRLAAPTRRLDLAEVGSLTFEAPDYARFPAPRLALDAFAAGGGATTVLNAANEIAVEAFLERRIGFTDITRIAGQVVDRAGAVAAPASLGDVLAIDSEARQQARQMIARLAA